MENRLAPPPEDEATLRQAWAELLTIELDADDPRLARLTWCMQAIGAALQELFAWRSGEMAGRARVTLGGGQAGTKAGSGGPSTAP